MIQISTTIGEALFVGIAHLTEEFAHYRFYIRCTYAVTPIGRRTIHKLVGAIGGKHRIWCGGLTGSVHTAVDVGKTIICVSRLPPFSAHFCRNAAPCASWKFACHGQISVESVAPRSAEGIVFVEIHQIGERTYQSVRFASCRTAISPF